MRLIKSAELKAKNAPTLEIGNNAVIHNNVTMKVNFSKASTYLLNCSCNDARFKKTRQISGVGQ